MNFVSLQDNDRLYWNESGTTCVVKKSIWNGSGVEGGPEATVNSRNAGSQYPPGASVLTIANWHSSTTIPDVVWYQLPGQLPDAKTHQVSGPVIPTGEVASTTTRQHHHARAKAAAPLWAVLALALAVSSIPLNSDDFSHALQPSQRAVYDWLEGAQAPKASPTQAPKAQVGACNFDAGLCDWVQDQSDDFDWTRKTGPTPSSGTGPSSGDGGSGYYLYIETSSEVLGKSAHLVSTGTGCGLEISYNMYGATIGSLAILSSKSANGPWTIKLTLAGDQGAAWKRQTVSWTGEHYVKIVGVRGTSYTGHEGARGGAI